MAVPSWPLELSYADPSSAEPSLPTNSSAIALSGPAIRATLAQPSPKRCRVREYLQARRRSDPDRARRAILTRNCKQHSKRLVFWDCNPYLTCQATRVIARDSYRLSRPQLQLRSDTSAKVSQ